VPGHRRGTVTSRSDSQSATGPAYASASDRNKGSILFQSSFKSFKPESRFLFKALASLSGPAFQPEAGFRA
jgi:hypothetical protein